MYDPTDIYQGRLGTKDIKARARNRLYVKYDRVYKRGGKDYWYKWEDLANFIAWKRRSGANLISKT